MDRRFFLKASAALPAAAATGAVPVRSAFAATPDGGPWRSFEASYRVEVRNPKGISKVWLPLPLLEETDYFRYLGSSWNAEGGRARIYVQPPYGAAMVHAEFPDGVKPPTMVLTSRFQTRDRAVDLSKPGTAIPEDAAVLKLALKSTDLIPTDGIVRDTALEVTKGARGDLEKARAIYEWVVENTFRDPKTRGCGWGDIKSMLETRNFGGKCGDLNAMFVGLARSVGIPARDVYGIRVAPSALGYKSLGANTEVISKGQHCRAEFYLASYGWVPVDPGDVRKVVLEEPPGNLPLNHPMVQAARKRLFGSWEMNWLVYNVGHDIVLPNSKGTKIPYLMYPNGESGGEQLDQLEPDTFKYAITWRELKT